MVRDVKILTVSDVESRYLWEYYQPGKLQGYDLVISCGDLDARYLSFLATFAAAPVLYVHGNHDADYEEHPPEGCESIEDRLVTIKGLRIAGLGGSMRYKPGPHQYTQLQMEKRARHLAGQIRRAGGVDILVTHAPAQGLGDAEDLPHQGFGAFCVLLDHYEPRYMLHGHVHLNYGAQIERVRHYHNTTIVNAYERQVVELEPIAEPPRRWWIFPRRNP